MAKVCYDDVIKHVHGSLTGESKVIFKHRSDSKTNYTSGRPEYKFNPTSRQQAAMTKFATARQNVEVILADAEQAAAYREAFKNQSKYATLRGYILAEVMKSN